MIEDDEQCLPVPEERTFANADQWFDDWRSRFQAYQRLIPDTVVGIKAGTRNDYSGHLANLYRIMGEKERKFAEGPDRAASWMREMEGNLNWHNRYLPILWQSVKCGTARVRADCGQVSSLCV